MNLSESRLPRYEERARDIEQTTNWYNLRISLCNPSLTAAMVYTVRIREIEVELNYGSVDSSLPFSSAPDFNS